MKNYKYILKNSVFLPFIIFSAGLHAQTGWIQKANYGGGPRALDVGFSIGHYGFVGCGYNGNSKVNDFWRYDIHTNTWTQIANYPGQGMYACTAFTIEGKGYVCFGANNSNVGTSDLWKYDTISNAWTQMATFPVQGWYDVASFVMGHNAYVLCGCHGGAPYIGQVWVYDAHQNTWKQLNSFPAGNVEGPLTFVIGNRGYAGEGYYNPNCNSAMYSYDTTSDTWTPIAPIPTSYGWGGNPRTWVLGTNAYAFNADQCTRPGPYDGWLYDTVAKSWCIFTNMAGPKLTRGYCVALMIDNKMFMGTGSDTNYTPLGDWWEFVPSTKINVSDTSNPCSSDSVHFNDSTSYIASAWNWSFPGGTPATSNFQNPVVYYSASGTYTATLILTACGGDDTVSRTFTVTAGALGGLKITGKTPICYGTSDTLTVSGNSPYLWSNGATSSSIVVTPLATTTYSVQVGSGACKGDTSITIIVEPVFKPVIAGKDSICSGTQDTLVASGGGSYLWSNSDISSSITVSPNSTTTYSVKVTNGCTEDTSFTVNVFPLPIISTTAPNSIICKGNSVTLNASGGTSYNWMPSTGLSCTSCPDPVASPSVTINYTVTGTDSHGCSSSINASVYVENPSSVYIVPSETTICAGFSVDLSANAIGGGTYNWEPGNSSASQITITPNTTTTYTVNYTNACGTSADTVTVFVSPSPVTRFTADVTSGCAPLCVQFRDLSTPSQGNIIMWSWALGNGDTLDEQNPVFCYRDTGSYGPSLTVISNDGCSSALKIENMITVFSKPIANFIYSPEPVNILEPTVQFTDKSTDAYGIAYRWWSFGDGETPDAENSLRNPSHTYQDTGMYCPQLIVENDKGCLDTSTQCLDVEPLFTLYIPSAFSPNGDGTNDFFAAKGTYIKSFEMYIFDRWGMELYHATDINRGWNGYVNGGKTICQEDTYVYMITATDWSDTQHSYIGRVTLLK